MSGQDREPGRGAEAERAAEADAFGHLLREGIEVEISAARAALEEARALLEGCLGRAEGGLLEGALREVEDEPPDTPAAAEGAAP